MLREEVFFALLKRNIGLGFYAPIHKTKLIQKDEKYSVSEGDTSDYWEATAANAMIPLMDMLNMALTNMNNPDAVWDGD